MATRKKYGPQGKAFEFFTSKVESNQSFTLQEIASYCGWEISTPRTYLTKKWAYFIEDKGGGSFKVRHEFKRIKKEAFLGQASQNSPVYTGYTRTRHDWVVMFEFLLPLTREDKLRLSLDELFYSDCIEQRIREIGFDVLERVIPRPHGTSDTAYMKILIGEVGIFGGYSILHVNGRFKAGSLTTRVEAGKRLALGERYLIDETTAVVRFIIPCGVGSSAFQENYGVDEPIHQDQTIDERTLQQEVSRIRSLFFLLFVEAVVRTVKGEDEIWLIESGVKNRLYRWGAK